MELALAPVSETNEENIEWMRSIIEAILTQSTMILKLKLSSLKEPLAIHSVFVTFFLTMDEAWFI